MPTMFKVRVNGEKLRQLRTDKFLSRREVADAAGLHPDHVGRLERGYGGGTRIENVRKIAQALEVDPHELVLEEDDDG